MNLTFYKLTEMERWIESLYKSMGILSPSNLTIDNLSKIFNIEVCYIQEAPQRAIWKEDEDPMIFLKPYQSEIKKREVFFHEFGHPLLHFGEQRDMNFGLLKQLQEYQANQFQLYASMPFYMFKELDIPKTEHLFINLVKDTFNISERLARKRVEQINRRMLREQMDRQFITGCNERPVFNYCKNIKPREFPNHTEEIVKLAISRKLAKESVKI
jgi:Zn-dependent peptidase ImmA (M78 family)